MLIEKPTMSYIYEFMDLTNDKIACNCGEIERKYDLIWKKKYIYMQDGLHTFIDLYMQQVIILTFTYTIKISSLIWIK